MKAIIFHSVLEGWRVNYEDEIMEGFEVAQNHYRQSFLFDICKIETTIRLDLCAGSPCRG